MKSQLKGGWMVKWNEIFNGLPTVIINEMEIWPCVWPSGRKQIEPLFRGPRKEDEFSEEQGCACYHLPLPPLEGFLKSSSLVHSGGSLVGLSGARELHWKRRSKPHHETRGRSLIVAVPWLPCLIGHLLPCSSQEAAFHDSVHSRIWSTLVSFTCFLSLNTSCKENSTHVCWPESLIPAPVQLPRTSDGFLSYKNCFCLIKHRSLWTLWGFFSACTFL